MSHSAWRAQQCWKQDQKHSVVNKDLSLKAKAKAKDLTFKAKAKAKDLRFKAKAKAKDLTFKAKAKAKDLTSEHVQGPSRTALDYGVPENIKKRP